MEKLLIGLLFLSGTVFAQEVTCKYDGSQLEMNACAVRDYSASDKLLNVEYTKALTRTKDKEKLRASQRAWIKQRDARCAPRKRAVLLASALVEVMRRSTT